MTGLHSSSILHSSVLAGLWLWWIVRVAEAGRTLSEFESAVIGPDAHSHSAARAGLTQGEPAANAGLWRIGLIGLAGLTGERR